MLETIIEVLAYAALGTVLMGLVSLLFDLIVPYDFQGDIAKGNKAAAWVCAGIYVGIGYLLRAVIADYGEAVSYQLLDSVLYTCMWAGIALVLLLVAYFALDGVLFRKINFNDEVKRGNEAVGIVVFGILVGLAFVISGAVM